MDGSDAEWPKDRPHNSKGPSKRIKWPFEICGKIFLHKRAEIKTRFFTFIILSKCKFIPNFLFTFSACMAQTVVLLTGTTQPFLTYIRKGKILILLIFILFLPHVSKGLLISALTEQKQSQFF